MLFDLDKKDTLIIIPARGGSQRVPNKNLRISDDKKGTVKITFYDFPI